MKVHQITFVMVVGLVVILCLMFGCKDKAKADEANDYDELVVVDVREFEPDEPKTSYTAAELDEIYKDEPALGKLAKELYGFTEPERRAKAIYNRALTSDEIAKIYNDPFYEPNDPEITQLILSCPKHGAPTFWLTIGQQGIKCCGECYCDFLIRNIKEEAVYSIPKTEPNEPEVESLHISMMSDDGVGFDKTYIGTESEIRKALLEDGVIPEPNEPECEHKILYGISQGFSSDHTICAVCGETLLTYSIGDADAVLHYHEPEPHPMKYTLPIPTWPDYIELEKDLHFAKPGTERQWRLPKGTKIYFKDD